MLRFDEANDRVSSLLADSPDEALRVAMAVDSPVNRLLLLGRIVRRGNPGVADRAIEGARAAAHQLPDAFSRAAALADLVDAAFGRGEHHKARRVLQEALACLPAMPTTSEQAEALRRLFAAALPGGPEVWSLLSRQLIERCPAHAHWRAARAHLQAVRMLKERDRLLAEQLVAAMKPGKTERRARRWLDG